MIYSMTGFGRSEFTFNDKNYVIEIKSLNGKNLDINVKLPSFLKPLEQNIRKVLTQNLVRGTIDCQIFINSNQAIRPVSINTALAKSYYANLSELTEDLGIEKQNILQVLMSMPEVVSSQIVELNEDEKEIILQNVQSSAEQVLDYRKVEGAALESEITNRINNISELLPQIEVYEKGRSVRIKERMIKQLSEINDDLSIDANRLEQEMIYYLEKLDISEEKQRLLEHCRLFHDNVKLDNSQGIGKKLNFILQEIGREINTLGSKANDSDIQKFVIEMKDELEKAKEQSLNVL